MKPIFCIDVTTNKHNPNVNGMDFATRQAEPDRLEKLENMANDLENTINTHKVPGWMVAIRSIAGFAALIMAMNLMKVALESGFGAIFSADHITVTLICLGSVAIYFYLNRDAKLREKKASEDPAIEQKTMLLEAEMLFVMNSMGVPANAAEIDVMTFHYKVKDGEIVPSAPMMIPTPFINFECKIFGDGDALCIADTQSVYSFKREWIKGLKKVDSKVSLYPWTKDDAPTDDKYYDYSLGYGKMGMVSAPCYYILEIERDGESFGLYIPNYEIATVNQVLSEIGRDDILALLPKNDDADEADDEDYDEAYDAEAEEASEAVEAADELTDEADDAEADELTDEADVKENDGSDSDAESEATDEHDDKSSEK